MYVHMYAAKELLIALRLSPLFLGLNNMFGLLGSGIHIRLVTYYGRGRTA